MKEYSLTEKKELEVLECGIWGTVGPRSVRCAERLAELVGARRGLLCHSFDAAMEAALRHFGIWHGKTIAVGAVCYPSDALIPTLLGAGTVFLPTDPPESVIGSEELRGAFAEVTPDCVLLDVPVLTDEWPLEKIAALCTEKKIPLLLNAGGFFRSKRHGRPLASFADAVLYSLEDGSEIAAGKGGFLAADSDEVYAGAFAFHNCGRSFTEGCTLEIEGILGGDLRVTEWTAAAAEAILDSGEFCEYTPLPMRDMPSQPLFGKAGGTEG